MSNWGKLDGICRCGGPIAWSCGRQDQTALSLCEAEIYATNKCVVDLISVKSCMADLNMADAHLPTTVYNDNQACVNWSALLTTKGIKHINLRENMICEAHQDNVATIVHIPEVINSSDIFTEEIKRDAHFRRLRNSYMVSRAIFLKHAHNVPEHWTDKTTLPYYSIRSPQSLEQYKRVLFAPECIYFSEFIFVHKIVNLSKVLATIVPI